MNQHQLMKSIIVAKTVLIVLAISMYQGWIKLGDVRLLAAGEGEKSAATSPESIAKNETGDKNEQKTISPQDVAGIEKKEKEKTTEPARRSFLADLFSLPKLNAKKIQRDELGKFMDLAERKERQVDERTSQLAKREEQLKALEQSIEQKIAKLEEERKFIAKTLQQEKDLKGERVDKIAELFDKMEPKKAAPAFEKLDKDLTVALFKKLKQKQVTTILENMNPEKSVEITEYFARVKSAKEYDILKELNDSLQKEFQECKGMTSQADAAPQKPVDVAKADGAGAPGETVKK